MLETYCDLSFEPFQWDGSNQGFGYSICLYTEIRNIIPELPHSYLIFSFGEGTINHPVYKKVLNLDLNER